MKKGFAAFCVLIAMCMIFTACSTGASPTTVPSQAATVQASSAASSAPAAPAPPSPIFDKPVTLSILAGANASWPWQADWYVGKMIQEKTKVTLNFIESDDVSTKINTMMASGDVPDLTCNSDPALFEKYGAEGAYASILDYASSMPNFSAWKDQNQQYLGDFLAADGKLYMFPVQGISETDRQNWMYRKDIFDKNGLSVPTNETEFFDTMTKLKQLYPDSYPFSFRNGLSDFEWFASSWGTGSPNLNIFYYDQTNKAWKFGPVEDNYRTMLEFFAKLYANKLIPPDFLTIDTKGWQDLMSNSKAFVTFDYVGRIDFFNNAVRPTDPNYTLTYMSPWKGGANGVAKMAYSGYANIAFALSAKSPKLQDALKYMDWTYTQEAKELMSWGEEGKTYNVVDGQKKFIGVTDMPSMRKMYGLSTEGYYTLFDYDAHISLFSKELAAAVPASRNDLLAPVPQVSMTDDEKNTFNQTWDPILKYVQDNVSKFILGELPLDDANWNAYVKAVQDMGLQSLIDIQTKAYDNQTAGK
jgi:putative aldouronate transport system substrate-binding protein